jgi:hypothetical protein
MCFRKELLKKRDEHGVDGKDKARGRVKNVAGRDRKVYLDDLER